MKCVKIEKWLSDRIDGELSRRKERKLEIHLRQCQNCRSYQKALEKINLIAGGLEPGKVEENYWQIFTLRIEKKVTSLKTEKKKAVRSYGLRWALVGASLIFISLLSLSILHFKPEKTLEVYVFNYEDTLEQLYQEAGESINLEDIIDRAILDSVEQFSIYPGEYSLPGVYGLINPWDEFTIEEINLLLSEGKESKF